MPVAQHCKLSRSEPHASEGHRVGEAERGPSRLASVSSMDRRSHIETRLRDAFAASHVDVVDESHRHAGHAGAASGGGHFRAIVVSARFEGLSRVARQRLVYEALAAEMRAEIHALALRTLTPAEWDADA